MVLRKPKQKLILSREEEFSILKLILDKFLWIATFASVFGLYMIVSPTYSDANLGMLIMLVGAFLFLLFTGIIMKEIKMHRNF